MFLVMLMGCQGWVSKGGCHSPSAEGFPSHTGLRLGDVAVASTEDVPE